MRYGIFSDIHSNLEAFDVVIEAYKKEAIDRYLCVGDIVGYGANPNECVEKTKALTDIIVAGNHDWAAVNLFSLDYFNPEAREAILWTRKSLDDSCKYFLESLELIYKNEDLTLVHGTLDNPKSFDYVSDGYIAEETFRRMETNICFIGHTHVPATFVKDENDRILLKRESKIKIEDKNKYIVNVGSVGQPRDGRPQSAYCVYDTEEREVEIKRLDYDIQAARQKILDSGLPTFLGDRLLIGV